MLAFQVVSERGNTAGKYAGQRFTAGCAAQPKSSSARYVPEVLAFCHALLDHLLTRCAPAA